jgi:neurotransmitter-gated ion-channel
MVIMSWSVFWFDPPEASSQVTIAVTTILTIIAFALAISLTLPRVPYLTFADGFFLTCYVFAFVTMVEVTVVHITYRNERHKMTAQVRRIARWLVPTAFVVANYDRGLFGVIQDKVQPSTPVWQPILVRLLVSFYDPLSKAVAMPSRY